MGELAIEASQIVSRLEQVAEGVKLPENSPVQPTVFLGLEQKKADDIIQRIEGLIAVDDDGEPTCFPILDDVSKLVITSHSIGAYCGGLERHLIQKLSTRFTTDTTRWLSQMFGLVLNFFVII